MTKKTYLILFIFVFITGTAHINLTASKEQESSRTGICQRIRQIFNPIFPVNQHANSVKKSRSKKETKLTDAEVERILIEIRPKLPIDLAKMIVMFTKEEKLTTKATEKFNLNGEIGKYNLYDEVRLNDPRLVSLPPLMRLVIPYKSKPNFDAFLLQ